MFKKLITLSLVAMLISTNSVNLTHASETPVTHEHVVGS